MNKAQRFPESFVRTRKRANTFAVPTLPIAICALTACLLASQMDFARDFTKLFFSLALGSVLVAASVKTFFFWSKRDQFKLTKIFVYTAVFFGFFGYYFLRTTPNPYPDFTARELTISILVDEVSKGKNDSRYGVGTILVPPQDFPKMEGGKLWFSVGDGAKAKSKNLDIERSQILKITGLVRPTRNLNTNAYTSDYFRSSLDFDKYLVRSNVLFKISARIADTSIIKNTRPPWSFYADSAKFMNESLSNFILPFQRESETAKTYTAMILGDKSSLTKNQKDSFSRTGTMHIFAISGLHIAFAASILFLGLSILRVKFSAQAIIALPILFLYAEATGGKPSAMRAFMMTAFFWLALAMTRGTKAWNVLIFSCIIALLLNPVSATDAGFALSYAVVASIFLYGAPLAQYLEKFFRPSEFVPDFVEYPLKNFARKCGLAMSAATAISVGAFFAGAPLAAYYFSYISPASILYSPIFVMFSGVAVGLGFAGFFLPSFLASILNSVAWFFVWAMSAGAQWGHSVADLSLNFHASGIWGILALTTFLTSAGLLQNADAKLKFLLPPLACSLVLSAEWIFEKLSL